MLYGILIELPLTKLFSCYRSKYGSEVCLGFILFGSVWPAGVADEVEKPQINTNCSFSKQAKKIILPKIANGKTFQKRVPHTPLSKTRI